MFDGSIDRSELEKARNEAEKAGLAALAAVKAFRGGKFELDMEEQEPQESFETACSSPTTV
jgi:hypothetical protein